MNEARIGAFKEFHDVVSRHHEEWRCWYYRGHVSTAYKLVPKVGRPPFAGKTDDRLMFERWKRHAIAYVQPSPSRLSEWDWLAIAQHHGLATRLLDWTFNPMAAVFFSLVDGNGKVDESRDSAVYAGVSPARRPLHRLSYRGIGPAYPGDG